MSALTVTPLPGVPDVKAGDDLAVLVSDALKRAGITLTAGDVLVLAQKIISKAEGRQVALNSVTPSPRAVEIGAKALKDPRLVELILSESTDVLRVIPNVI